MRFLIWFGAHIPRRHLPETAVPLEQAQPAPLSLAPTGDSTSQGATPDMLAALQAIPQMVAQDKPLQSAPITINYPVPLAVARARAAARAAQTRAV